MESRGKKEERQGTEEEGKAKGGTPPRERRARGKRQRRHSLWYDEGDRTKTSEPKKGRRAPLYHTTRARDAPGLHKPPDTGLGLERDHSGGTPDHAPPVRREARPAQRDLEARIPARGNRGSRPGPEGQATRQIRRIRPLQEEMPGQSIPCLSTWYRHITPATSASGTARRPVIRTGRPRAQGRIPQ